MQRDDRLPIPVSWWRSVCLRIRLTSVPSSSHGRTNGRRALSSRQMMALDAARLYHLRGLDQAAVAQVLHVSRPQVSKLLATARELGYIRTHVVDPRESDRELVQTVTQRFRIPRTTPRQSLRSDDRRPATRSGCRCCPLDEQPRSPR